MAIGPNRDNTIWTQTYTSFSGCDIQALIEDALLGNIQGVSFSVTREKAPIYVMGSVDPVSFSRGKRGIAGSLIFTNFDREALFDIKNRNNSSQTVTQVDNRYWKKITDINAGGRAKNLKGADLTGLGSILADPNYSDQIPPFTISLTGANESGQTMVMAILGVELLNEGVGISIDDIVNETQMTFVARTIIPWQPGTDGQIAPGLVAGDSSIAESLARNTTAFQQAQNFPSA